MKNKKNDDNQKPRIDLDLDKPEYKKGLTWGQWKELRQKDPATLTPSEKTAVDEADAAYKKMIADISPRISSMFNFSQQSSEVLNKTLSSLRSFGNFQIPIPSFGLTSTAQEEFSGPLTAFDFDLSENVLHTTAREQRKQTIVLEKLLDAISSTNIEKNLDQHRAISPRYIAENRLLIFANTPIEIPAGDQERLCRALFRAERPIKKPQERGDILEKMRLPRKDYKKLYSAKQAINLLVELLRQNMTNIVLNGVPSKSYTKRNWHDLHRPTKNTTLLLHTC